jgi:glucosamine-6-phosphate deaminase
MGAELVYQARTVVLLANGERKARPVAESLLGEVTPDVPISYGQVYAKRGGHLVYVLDKIAAGELLIRKNELKEKKIGIKVV